MQTPWACLAAIKTAVGGAECRCSEVEAHCEERNKYLSDKKVGMDFAHKITLVLAITEAP